MEPDGCYSSVGYQNRPQIINLGGLNCVSTGIIVHELLHGELFGVLRPTQTNPF